MEDSETHQKTSRIECSRGKRVEMGVHCSKHISRGRNLLLGRRDGGRHWGKVGTFWKDKIIAAFQRALAWGSAAHIESQFIILNGNLGNVVMAQYWQQESLYSAANNGQHVHVSPKPLVRMPYPDHLISPRPPQPAPQTPPSTTSRHSVLSHSRLE
jgi:hypothetical protein